MKNVVIWISMSIAGLALSVILGGLLGGLTMAIVGILSGIIMFVPLMQMITVAKNKRFLPLFFNLGEENGVKKEKFIAFPDQFGRLNILIAQIKYKGICFIKNLGIVDDKGTEYAFGNDPISFGEPRRGYTVNVKSAQYHYKLRRNKGVNDYDEMIRKYLGEEGYKTFLTRFRTNPEPSASDIQNEISYLIAAKPVDNLSELVFGETWSFKDDLNFLKYNYHPVSMKNAVDTERIIQKRIDMGYKDTDKAMSRAKAVVLIVIAVVILIAVLSSLDLSKIGSFFGGGH
jgi:hypothetical protein